MLKFIRGKGQQPSAERQKLQNELFAFRKTVQHGFPHRASALSWDPLLRLVAIGTATGALKVYGQPGVEFYGQHTNADATVTHIHFIHGSGRLVSLCDDNSLHLWEINEKSLVELKTFTLEGKNKKISATYVEASGEHILLGTEGGNVYALDLNTFALTEDAIYQDVVMQSCPEDFKVNPGAVECICEHPVSPTRLLVGYTRGLIILWDRTAAAPTHTFVSNQQLESVCWDDDGNHLTSSHNDGSYVTWEVGGTGGALREPVSPYGPYPCKPIYRLVTRTATNGDQLLIYAGGMPRASYSDKYTVTVQQGDKHVAFDFTSRVIDFFTTTPVPADGAVVSDTKPTTPVQALLQTVKQQAATLVVLAEEELVVIDLTDASWRPLRLPYLVSIHASAITTMQLLDNVAQHIYDTLLEAGKQQTEKMYSVCSWPISGGVCAQWEPEPGGAALLLTGHEDGSVRFWDVSHVPMTPLYHYTTAPLFSGEDLAELNDSQNEEEEWPPFKKVGTFDPYSDDPRLAVKKVVLCPLSGMLTIGGAAGHIVIASLKNTAQTGEIKTVSVNIVSDRDGFVWKGHDQLTLRAGPHTFQQGYQAMSVILVSPPGAVTSLACQWEWGVVAVGTAHGVAVVDVARHLALLHKCTLNPHDHSGAGDTPISRRKSFKKSLRESFRRLRKGRSQRRQTTAVNATSPTPVPKKVAEEEVRPVERAVEARPADDAFGSMVRCLYLTRTFLLNSQNSTPTLWAGTNNGTVYAFTLTVPNTNKRKDEPVTCQLAKEIQLKHRAPVIGITILDGASVPLPDPLEVERGISPLPESGTHRVLIASEEQFKIFTLPSLKPYNKYKLTAHEGARVRRTSFAYFECYGEGSASGGGSGSGRYREWCLLCLTNLGDCLVFSPELRRQLNAAAVRKEDINGITSLCFSKRGEALYLHSSSELQRISLSATKVTVASCHVPLPPWAAPPTHSHTLTDIKEETGVSGVTGETGETGHDVTAASGDITVDSVRDHTQEPLNINLQNCEVNTSSMVVKTTTRTTVNDNHLHTPTTTTTTTTTTNSTQENILEHSREEGVITRIESGVVTVPAGTDPKLILEMFDRQRTPLEVPTPDAH